MENLSAYQDIPNLSEISSRRGLKFLHLNVCPLLPKTDKIRLLLQRYKNTDCFSVTETHVSAQVSDDEIGIQGCTIYLWINKLTRKGAVLLFMFAIVCRYLDAMIWNRSLLRALA